MSSTYTNCLYSFAALIVAGSCHAMQSIDDRALGEISGQDGILLTASAASANIGRLRYEDEPGRVLDINNAQVAPSVPGGRINTSLQLQTGSNAAGQPALQAEIRLSAVTIDAESLTLDNTGDATAPSNLGRFTFKTTQDTLLSINTSNGFLNRQGNAEIKLKLDNADVFITETQNSGAINNQLVLGNLRLDVDLRGSVYVDDAGGLVVDADSITLNPNGSDAGIQLALLHKGNVGADFNTYDSATANGIARIGASGEVVNTKLSLRGTNATSGAQLIDPTLSVVGSKGIALTLEGELTPTTSFDLSEAGANGYGLRFSDIKPFNPYETRAPFSFGTTYINLVNINQLSLPQTELAQARNTRLNGIYIATQLANPADYVQTLTSGERLAILNRGFELQGIAQKAEFTLNANANNVVSTPPATSNSFGISPNIYNLNGNVTVSSAGAGNLVSAKTGNTLQFDNRLNLSVGVSTEGVNSDGTKTTSLLITDNVGDTYLGLRNIDLLALGQGVAGISNQGIHVNFNQFLVAFSTEIAAGALPSTANTVQGGPTSFVTQDDTLFALRGRISASQLNFDLLPANNAAGENYIGYAVDLTLNPDASSFVQIVEPSDSSTVGFDKLTGRVRIADGRIDILEDGGRFYNDIRINPTNDPNQVFSVGEINFYPATAAGPVGNAQTLGRAVLTGGRLISDLTIRPVD